MKIEDVRRITCLLKYVQTQLNDESIRGTKAGAYMHSRVQLYVEWGASAAKVVWVTVIEPNIQ
jgi:hypothetical protein